MSTTGGRSMNSIPARCAPNGHRLGGPIANQGVDAYIEPRGTQRRFRSKLVDESATVLARLMAVVESRKAAAPENSYTSRLLAGGVPAIGAKVTEEAAEVVEAAGEAGEEGRLHLVREAADLVYHLLVLLAARNASLQDVEAELARRFGISGLEEKASRPASPN